MATHYSVIASGHAASPAVDALPANDNVLARAYRWIHQMYCGLHGHDSLLRFERDRMFLQCASCGHETPGWELSAVPRPIVRARGDSRRHVMRPRLVTARRVA